MKKNWLFRFFDLLRKDQQEPKEKEDKEEQVDKLELVKAFASQFAETHNHYQKLFIQFLSSVLIVLVAYAFVYSNTASNTGMVVHRHVANEASGTKKGSNLDTIHIQAEKFSIVKYEEGALLSFPIVSLLGIYLFAQIVLLVLSAMILHLGYSYRRDQGVIHRIRLRYFGDQFRLLFGTKGYQSNGKGLVDYLPNFNSIMFGAIVLIQVALGLTIFLFLDGFDKKDWQFFVFLDHGISIPQLQVSIFFPVLVNFFLYTFYYNKYENYVNGTDTYLPLMHVVEYPATQVITFSCIYVIVLAAEIYFALAMHVYTTWASVLFTIIMIAPLFFQGWVMRNTGDRLNKTCKSSENEERKVSNYYLRIIQAVTYIVCGATMAYKAITYLWNFNYSFGGEWVYILIPLGAFLVKLVTPWILHVFAAKKDFEDSIANYFKQHTRFFGIIFYFVAIGYLSQLKWLDCVFAFFFGVYSFIVGRRTFIKSRFGLYDDRFG